MLILTRKVGQSIKVGENIKVTVLGVKNTHVKLGIEAPEDVEVWREEIYEEIKNKGQPPDGA